MTSDSPTASADSRACLIVFYLGDAAPSLVSALLATEEAKEVLADLGETPLAWGIEPARLEAIDGRSPGAVPAVPFEGGADDLLAVAVAASGKTVVFVGEAQAREAWRLVQQAQAEGLEMMILPAGTDLQRQAILSDLWRLHELTRTLRRECPWDSKQTPETIVAYTVEETYELVDTVKQRQREGGEEAVRDELGDLLFQVYFLACLAEEEDLYDLGEVAAGIHQKLVRRHPHIFAEARAETADDVRRTWDVIKKESEGRQGIFHDVPSSFPATLLAQKLQQRAAAVGFDWEQVDDVLPKLKEEIGEIEHELATDGGRERVAAEMGDLLFAVINLSRKLRVDPELALRGAAQRFQQRVEGAARIAETQGLVFEDLTLEQKETYYQHAKEELKR